MKYFKPEEFRGFYDKMDPQLLKVIEEFRRLWGDVVIVSPAPGALGRTSGTGFHNYVYHGSLKAIDLMPNKLTKARFREALDKATKAGATGVGLYPDWTPQPGIHIDVGVRKGRGPGNPATWSGIKVNGVQVYRSIEEVL